MRDRLPFLKRSPKAAAAINRLPNEALEEIIGHLSADTTDLRSARAVSHHFKSLVERNADRLAACKNLGPPKYINVQVIHGRGYFANGLHIEITHEDNIVRDGECRYNCYYLLLPNGDVDHIHMDMRDVALKGERIDACIIFIDLRQDSTDQAYAAYKRFLRETAKHQLRAPPLIGVVASWQHMAPSLDAPQLLNAGELAMREETVFAVVEAS